MTMKEVQRIARYDARNATKFGGFPPERWSIAYYGDELMDAYIDAFEEKLNEWARKGR